jgi:hypothetical protein
MDAIREQYNKPVVLAAASFIVGLLIGLIVLGWGLWPVQWEDAAPSHLHPGFQADYLRMAIDSYSLRPDGLLAKQRFDDLGENAATVLAEIQADPAPQDANAVSAFSSAVQAAPALPGETAVVPGEEPVAEEGGSNLLTILGVMCLITLVLGAGLIGYFWYQNRRATIPEAPGMVAREAAREAEWTDYAQLGEEAPMAQFMASYKIGDDLFDDSFSIDSPSGEFLGECGVGISETIGVGDPKKVTAFEVWLFDKNDIQTVTKVLMSAHAFEDVSIRQRLEAKGEPVLADTGSQAILETATLRLVARIVDMSYGEGALPENSFIDSVILELAVWQK